jgi:hypothetical protein
MGDEIPPKVCSPPFWRLYVIAFSSYGKRRMRLRREYFLIASECFVGELLARLIMILFNGLNRKALRN